MEQKGSNQSLVKVTNQNLIIREIRSNKQLSRSDLAKRLQLSNPSVSKHVDDLISKGLLIESGSMVTDIGRRPIMLEFNGSHGCVAVIDLSSNDARICVADLLGNKLEYSRVEGKKTITLDVIDRIITTLHDMLSHLGDRCGALVSICIGAPGVVNPENGLIQWSMRFENGTDLDLVSIFKKAFKSPVIVKNDINLAVVGERIFGAGDGRSSMLMISVDAGVGLGAIIDGKLFEGARGYACELGSMLDLSEHALDGTPENNDYSQYTIESLLNIYRLVADVRDIISDGRESVLREWLNDPAELSFDDVARAYGMNDPAVTSVVKRFARRVAIVCKNLTSLFDAEIILLGGLSAKLGMPFLEEVEYLYSLLPGCSTTELKLSRLLDSAVIFGGIDTATQYAIDRIIEQ